MSRSFENDAAEKLSTSTVPVSAVPLTMCCMFNADNVTEQDVLLSLGVAGQNNHRQTLFIRGDAGDVVQAQTKTTGNSTADTSTSYTAGTWFHACGVWASSTSRAVYIDGGSKGTDAVDLTPDAPNEFAIGERHDDFLFLSGDIAEVAVWDVALTDAEVAILGKAYSPLFVRPASLVGYWPIIGRNDPETDLISGNDLTVAGTPAAAPHPPMIYPSVPHAIVIQAVAAGIVLFRRRRADAGKFM